MSADKILYDSHYWDEKIGPEMKSETLERRLHLLFSLLMFLQLSVRQTLIFIFSCDIKEVSQRAARFMGYTPTADDNEKKFPPGAIFQKWHERYPNARPWMHEMIKPCAIEILEKESNVLIKSSSLKIKMKTLTLKKIQEILEPGRILETYKELAPFTWELLYAFATAPNEYRKRSKKGKEREGDGPNDDWDDDPNVAEHDPERLWNNVGSKPAGFSRNPALAVMMAITMLIFVRNQATNILPLIFGLFLKINGTSSRVMSVLSNLGLCVSGRTVERLKKRISEDAVSHAIDLITSGHLFCTIFDNINIYQRKFQQRITNQNSMINATNSAIIAIDEEGLDVPRVEDLQEKLRLHGQRVHATFEDILPSANDDRHLKKAFTHLIANMLLSYCPSSQNWKGQREMKEKVMHMMPQDRPLKVKKTDARPFGVFDVNEGSKKGIVQVLASICERTTLTIQQWSSKTRLILGDWLTSNHLRAARRDRADDVNSMERVEYAEELSMLWHFALQNTHAIMRTHFGHAVLDPTSLAAHKGLLGRIWDANKPNYAAAKSLIRHSLIARLLHITMRKQQISQWSDLANWQPKNFTELSKLAEDICNEYTTSSSAEKMKKKKDDWLAHDIYFIRDALLFCEFEQAVAHADAGRVLRVLKYWCFAFRGAGQHNYARECAEVLIKWKYELDEMLRGALERAWFVNRWGKDGRWIAADLYLEQLNFWVKRVFIAQGNGVTVQYIIEKGSACVEAFRGVTELVSRFFGNPEISRHSKEIAFLEDMRVLVEDMEKHRLHYEPKEREVLVTKQPSARKTSKKTTSKPPVVVSAIIDVQVAGAEIWQAGKFQEFIKNTTYDRATGYPIPESEDKDEVLNTGGIFDSTDENPLDHDNYEDLHGDDEDGLGSLGGGGEYSTGEIIL